MIGRAIARMLGSILIVNAIFLGLMLITPYDPVGVGDRIRAAFATGDLGLEEYRRRDIRHGWHQYNDCAVLQLLSAPDSSRVSRALAPRWSFLRADVGENLSCGTLKALTVDGASRDSMTNYRYSRYWHGYMVPVGFGLQVMNLAHVRRLLLISVCISIVVLTAAALRARSHSRRIGLAIASAWLAALVLAAVRDESRPSAIDARVVALVALGAFGVGGMITVVIKQILAALFAEPAAGSAFMNRLGGYMAVPAPRDGIPGLLVPYVQLVSRMFALTEWHRAAARVLVWALVIGWFLGVARGWRHRHDVAGRDVIFLCAIGLLPALWVLVVPTHTLIHASFMVRMTVVPISMAAAALLWPVRTRTAAPTTGEIARETPEPFDGVTAHR